MPIIITGMHRSGTSLTAAIVRELGVFLGEEEDLMSPAPDNADGFYERRDIWRLNEALLKRAGASWHHPPSTPDFWKQGLEIPLRQLQDRAASSLQKLEAHAPWAVKDPRFCLTLTFWQTLIPDARFLICVRNPLEVARSLWVREGLEEDAVLHLWQTGYQWLDEYVPPERRLVVAYTDLLERSGPSIQRLCDWLGLPPDETRLESARLRIRPELRHHQPSTEADSKRSLSAALADRYRQWLSEAGQGLAAYPDSLPPACFPSPPEAFPPETPVERQVSESESFISPPPFHAMAAFLECIRTLNAFTGEDCLPAYQVRILESGQLSIISPQDGKPVCNTDSLYLPGNKIAYRFESHGLAFWLITGDIQFGYPLTWLLSPCHRLLIRLAEGVTGSFAGIDPLDYWMKAIDLTLADRGFRETSAEASNPVIITLGHRNFAHHLWNELSGLDAWLAQCPEGFDRPVILVPLREPLGCLEELFPESAHLDIRRADVSPKAINRIPGCRVPIGSRKISTRVRERVDAYLARVSGPVSRRIEQDFIQRHHPVFWLSVRDHDRTCQNQEAFLAALASALLQAHPHSGILLDGFAFASDEADFDTLLVSERRAIQVAETIERLKLRIGGLGAPEHMQRLCSVSGIGLLDNLHLARFADYYVCHAGTLQHKLGWLHLKPGMMHTGVQNDNACRSIAAWYAHQVEEGVAPAILPPQFLSIVNNEDQPDQPARNKNYRIEDIPGAIDHILKAVAMTIEPSSGEVGDTIKPEIGEKAGYEYRLVQATQRVSFEPPVRLDTRTPPHPRLGLRSGRMPDSGVAIIPGGKACLEWPCQYFDASGLEVREIFDPVAKRPERVLSGQEWHRLEGRVCPVVVQGGGIFAHWLGDILPALHLVERAGVDFDTIDHWILNRKDQAYHRESLQKLGIPEHKVIAWSPSLRFVEADEWVVPGRARTHLYTAPWIIEWLRSVFVPDWNALSKQSGGLRLYLSRGKASKRRVINEAEVTEYLITLGFQVLHLENRSLTEAAHWLTRADVVVAPHGAGLANMVFCKPATRLIELYSWHISQEYWMTAQTLGLDYANLACPGPDGRYYDEIDLDYTHRFAEINSADIQVDIETLQRVLEASLQPVCVQALSIPGPGGVIHTAPTGSTGPSLPPVFVFAACWRTGSTLLQRVLNASDELMIWGEPGYLDLMRRVYDMLIRQTANQEKLWDSIRETGLVHNWLPNLAPRQEWSQAALQEFFNRLYFSNTRDVKPGCRTWGMKEVRAGAVSNAAFIQRIFPDARFIFLFRDPVSCFESVIASPFYRNFEDPLYPMKVYHDNLQGILALQEQPPTYACHFIRYEDLTGVDRSAVLDELFAFIGVSRPVGADTIISGKKLGGSQNKAPLSLALRSQLADLMGSLPGRLGYEIPGIMAPEIRTKV